MFVIKKLFTLHLAKNTTHTIDSQLTMYHYPEHDGRRGVCVEGGAKKIATEKKGERIKAER